MKIYLVKYLVEGIYQQFTVFAKNILDCHEQISTVLGYEPKVVFIYAKTRIQ